MADPWPQSLCDFCENYHCDVCGSEMGIEEHGPSICVRRRNENAAHHVRNQVAWGNEDAARGTLERAERQGWLDELEQTMVRLGFIEPAPRG